MARDDSLTFFRLFKWAFNELNLTNVKVFSLVNNVGVSPTPQESSIQDQVNQVVGALKIMTNEMLKLKRDFEFRILVLEDKMDRAYHNLEKVINVNKTAINNEVESTIS